MARNRHEKKQTKLSWLEHRTDYPSPEEREAIIERRYELRMELITLMARDSPNSPEGQRLSQKYGQEEVSLALNFPTRAFSREMVLTIANIVSDLRISAGKDPSSALPTTIKKVMNN